MDVKLRWPRRKAKTLRGGHDPRELQRLGVEARRQRKRVAQEVDLVAAPGVDKPTGAGDGQASGVVPAASRGHGRGLDFERRPPDLTSLRLHAGPRSRSEPQGTKAAEHPSERWQRETTNRQRAASAPKPEPDPFPDFPRNPGETTSDYWLRKHLDSQARWREIQRANGTDELEERWPRLIASPEQFFA